MYNIHAEIDHGYLEDEGSDLASAVVAAEKLAANLNSEGYDFQKVNTKLWVDGFEKFIVIFTDEEMMEDEGYSEAAYRVAKSLDPF